MILTWIMGLQKGSHAQEMILPLSYNSAIKPGKVPLVTLRNTLSLPFLDDFSYQSVFPDPDKWADRQAFVNTTFPLNPPSIGVATLDGLNENGSPYDSLSHSFFSIGGADTLTSQSILLGSYVPADSVFFSFFYEPGGLGDAPNTYSFNISNFAFASGDSLVVEFKDNAGIWRHMLAIDGGSADTFSRKALIIQDSVFLHDDFQFRFRNYASLIGQYDVWNIDYVEMDTVHNNFNTTTFIEDPAVQFLPTSILKNYEEMPWNQFRDFQSTEKADTIVSFLRNNSSVSENTSYGIHVYDALSGTVILDANPSIQFDAHQSLAKPFEFPQSIPVFDTAVIATRISVTFAPDKIPGNDTVTRYQVFSNYLAYDDGTPEASYRLLGSPASLAMQFHLNTPDTLQAVEILFSHSNVNLASNLFSIYVWKSLDPEDSLLRDEFLLPQFTDSINGFAFYRLSRPLFISDTFYIGWQQVSLQSDLKMDVGFDLNDTANQHLWFNTDGTWQQSGLLGALMIRPVLGKTIPFNIGVDEVSDNFPFTIFPNPASEEIYISGAGKDYLLEVMDYSGMKIISVHHQSSINVHELAQGMYLLQVTDLNTGKSSIQKFVKSD